jgi:phosphohistidine phosphatase
MKTLLLIRHAKSGYNISPGKTDLERPLNETGKHEALLMGKMIARKIGKLDLIVCSPAQRTMETLEIISTQLTDPQPQVTFEPSLYHPSVESFFRVIEALPKELETVVLISHNPGITDFINQLGIVKLDSMPTCGVMTFGIETNEWIGFSKASKKFLFFEKPNW